MTDEEAARWAEMPQHERPWRTQIEVIDIDSASGDMLVFVAGSPLGIVEIQGSQLPAELRGCVQRDQILHARVNTGALDASSMRFTDWEQR